MSRSRFLFGSILLLAAAAAAVEPRHWTVRSFDGFLRGRGEGVSINFDGVVSLAAPEEKVAGPSEDFYLSLAVAPEGTAYLGTGHGGKIYRLGADGAIDLHFQTAEMDVTCLLLDAKGVLYAGTSPNGRIYRITAAGKGEEWFNPQERYIWDLLLTESGSLLAAVGENGGVYEISPQGREGRSIFKAEQNHILCLMRDRGGDLLAGSGGPGLVYRIAGNGGKASVIFETPYEEVRSMAVDLDGNIYASAGGEVKPQRADSASPAAAPAGTVDVSVSVSAESRTAVSAGAAAPALKPLSVSTAREPGAIYRIGREALAERIWFSSEEQVYSLYWNEAEKKIGFGTGPKGRLYTLDGEGMTEMMLQSPAEQIFACLPVGTRLYLLANNPAGLSRVSPGRRMSGEYLGPVWDARLPAAWGRIDWEAVVPPEAVLQFQTRSGNTSEPGAAWSDWSPPYQNEDGEAILSPPARYLQVRALLKSTSSKAGPSLSRLNVHFLPANAAPTISRLELLEPNTVFLKPPDISETIWGLERRRLDSGEKKNDLGMMAAKKVERPGYRTMIWSAEDENGDVLVYTIALKRNGDPDWRTIEERWPEEIYAFNTNYFPEGVYQVKVAVSDAPSNPAGKEKKGEKTVGPLLIDNTAPVIRDVKAVREAGQLSLAFTAEDAFLPVKDTRVLIRPDDWRIIEPVDGIADSKIETYQVRIPIPTGADDLVTIVVRDATDNTATVRQIF